jgi:hypothetical protein
MYTLEEGMQKISQGEGQFLQNRSKILNFPNLNKV